MLRQQLFTGCQLKMATIINQRQNAERHKILCKAEGALLVMIVSRFVTKPSHFTV